MEIFITGTDTDSGKTYVTCLLLDYLKQKGKIAVGYKPFCSGGREDVVALKQYSSGEYTLEELNPIWLKTPASPYAAALIENVKLDFAKIDQQLQKLSEQNDLVLIEGAGGWEVPLTADQTLADYVTEKQWPVVLVVNNRLGALNQAILNVKNIQSRGLNLLGLVLNYVGEARDAASISNRMILENMGFTVLGEIMHGEIDAWEVGDQLFADLS